MQMQRKTEVVGIRVSTETKKQIDNLSKGDNGRLRETLEYIINTSMVFPGVPDEIVMIDKTFWRNQWKFTSKKGAISLADDIFVLFTRNPSLKTFDDYITATELWFKAHGTIMNIIKDENEYRILIPHNMHKNLSLLLYELFKQLTKITKKQIKDYKITNDYISMIFE